MYAAAKAGVVPKPELKTELPAPEENTEPEPRAQGDKQQSAAQWNKEFYKNNRVDYNAFQYRLNKAGAEATRRWKEVKETGTAANAEAFVKEVITGTLQKVDEIRVKMDREEAAETWKTWKQALKYHDEDTLKAMIKANTLESRRDPMIPENVGVEWPKYLQVKIAEEKSVKRKDAGRTAVKAKDVDDEEYEEEILDLGPSGPPLEAAPH